MDCVVFIPAEIVELICAHLNPLTLRSMRLVSRQWNETLHYIYVSRRMALFCRPNDCIELCSISRYRQYIKKICEDIIVAAGVHYDLRAPLSNDMIIKYVPNVTNRTSLTYGGEAAVNRLIAMKFGMISSSPDHTISILCEALREHDDAKDIYELLGINRSKKLLCISFIFMTIATRKLLPEC